MDEILIPESTTEFLLKGGNQWSEAQEPRNEEQGGGKLLGARSYSRLLDLGVETRHRIPAGIS